MGSGGERARAESDRILRPKLLLSAALAALIIAAPTGERTSALAMNLGSNFGAARVSSGPHSFVPRGNFGGSLIGNGREPGVVGRGDPGKGLSGNPCKPGRGSLGRCVVNTGGDHPGGGDGNRRSPRRPIWIHPIVPAT